MHDCDRLEALISRFEMSVTPAPGADGNLAILGSPETGAPRVAVFAPRAEARCCCEGDRLLVSAHATWGGAANPLLKALPDKICYDATGDPEMTLLLRLIKAEIEGRHCGVRPVLSRLGEVLVIKLLREEITRGATTPGLVAGLADPRLARAIVAMHEAPGRGWRNEELAAVAGLSLSRFAETFLKIVGETPQAYLRRWRMTLARQDIERGERVQTVARRYGYASAEALSRAFMREFEVSPLALRRRAVAA
ncbi:MAG TPA: AraC family transcriptional regulator [Thermohalobaculum sp.]|nr:AraC family transcriptional regulator [Thermohalobaculum sp.]